MNKSKKITCPLELLFKLKNLYYYNEVDGVFTRKIDSGKTAKAGSILSNKASNGYLVLFIDGHPYQSSRLAWLYNYGEMPIKKIKYRTVYLDKIKRNIKDNCWGNCRNKNC